MESLVLEPPYQQQATPTRRRSERLANKTEAEVSGVLQLNPANDPGTTSAEASHWYPFSSPNGASGSEMANTPRRRRPRVSYSTLTEDERYQRIRDLNNEASRQYRGRMRDHVTSLQEREGKEKERNRVLNIKVAGLEKLRDEIKKYTNDFIRNNMGNIQTQ